MQTPRPYKVLLQELMDSNDCEESLLIPKLNSSREFVKKLRDAYRKSPSYVDYGNPFFRAAYLFAYYPKYTEVLFAVLRKLPGEFSSLFESERVRACFFGAGPAPEVIGWIRYLSSCTSIPTHAHAYLLDKEICGWHKGHEITRYHLAPLYWQEQLVISAHRFDFCASDIEDELVSDEFVKQAFRLSRLFVMQNCINDQLAWSSHFMTNLLEVFKHTPRGSLFVLIDLALSGVKEFMSRFEDEVIFRGIGNVIIPTADSPRTIGSSIDVPEVVVNELFDPSNGLYPSRNVRFYFSIIEREDTLPF